MFRVLFPLSHFNPQFLHSFLVNSSNITKPFSVRFNSSHFFGSLVHFLFVWFLVVHVESFDGGFGTEGVVFAVSIGGGLTIGVGGSIGFGTLGVLGLESFVSRFTGFF